MQEEEIMEIINDIWKYLIGRNDYETNQQYISFKNEILVKYYAKFYLEYWNR